MALATAKDSTTGNASLIVGDDRTKGMQLDSNSNPMLQYSSNNYYGFDSSGNPAVYVGGTQVSKWVSGSVTRIAHKTNISAASSGTGVKAAIQNPLGVTAILERVIVRVDTAQGGTSTWDLGVSVSDITTTGDNIMDGVDGNATANTIYDSILAASCDPGSSGHPTIIAKRVGSAGGIVFTVATGNGQTAILTVTSYWSAA